MSCLEKKRGCQHADSCAIDAIMLRQRGQWIYIYKRIYACSEPQNNCWFLIIDIVDIQNVIDIKQYVNKCVYIYKYIICTLYLSPDSPKKQNGHPKPALPSHGWWHCTDATTVSFHCGAHGTISIRPSSVGSATFTFTQTVRLWHLEVTAGQGSRNSRIGWLDESSNFFEKICVAVSGAKHLGKETGHPKYLTQKTKKHQ